MSDSAWIKTVGKFDIYVPENYAESVLAYPDHSHTLEIRATIKDRPTDLQRRAAYMALCDIATQLASEYSKDRLNLRINTHSFEHPLLGYVVTELETSAYTKVKEAVSAINSVDLPMDTIVGEILPTIEDLKFSLSCALKDGEYRYCKVRFNGYSTRFYFNDEKWLEDKTVQSCRYPYSKKKMVMQVIRDNSAMLLKRALSKPINKSGIGLSTPMQLHVLIPAENGSWKLAMGTKVHDPSVVPVFLVREDSYSRKHNYLVDEKGIYLIEGWIRKRKEYEYNTHWLANHQKLVSPDYVEDLSFNKEDESIRISPKNLVTADLDDYTKQRIERAIKRKL